MIAEVESEYLKETAATFNDNLTGLFNHGFFLALLSREQVRYSRHGQSFSLAIIDIDEFSRFNTTHGAIKGDRLLVNVANIISCNIRDVDVLARFSGNQFAVLFIGTLNDQAISTSERIRKAIETGTNGFVTVSIGITSVDQSTNQENGDMINQALYSLSQAKMNGRNKIYNFPLKKKSSECGNQRILIVDDNPLNLKLMEDMLYRFNCDILKADRGKGALYILDKTDIDLVLLDVMMPDMDGFEVCRAIKSNEKTRMIPVILVTSLDDMESKVKGIDVGADDFIQKPPNKPELFARIRSLLKLKKSNSNLISMENVLFSLARAVEAKDSYTQGHVDRVSEMAITIGKTLDCSQHELEALRFGGTLHDIGKLGIPGDILNKPGNLTNEEWQILKTHPVVGHKICMPLKKNLGEALSVVRHHHEKLDGSGYPDGLKGDKISTCARIMAVADIYDALITDRAYRKAMEKKRALELLQEDVMNGKLDGDIVACLISIVN